MTQPIITLVYCTGAGAVIRNGGGPRTNETFAFLEANRAHFDRTSDGLHLVYSRLLKFEAFAKAAGFRLVNQFPGDWRLGEGPYSVWRAPQ